MLTAQSHAFRFRFGSEQGQIFRDVPRVLTRANSFGEPAQLLCDHAAEGKHVRHRVKPAKILLHRNALVFTVNLPVR